MICAYWIYYILIYRWDIISGLPDPAVPTENITSTIYITMKDQPETSRLAPSSSLKILEVLDKRVSVAMMLDVEMDQVPFHLSADGDSAVISFDSFSDAMTLFKKYKATAGDNNEHLVLFKRMLAKIGLTICYRNHHLGFIGPNANLILSKIFSFATSSTRKSKASLL